MGEGRGEEKGRFGNRHMGKSSKKSNLPKNNTIL